MDTNIMIIVLVVSLILAGLILWLTIFVTNKAYARKWELDDPKETTDYVIMDQKAGS